MMSKGGPGFIPSVLCIRIAAVFLPAPPPLAHSRCLCNVALLLCINKVHGIKKRYTYIIL